jgi:NAD-dependent SIR2 family protein deacetylase
VRGDQVAVERDKFTITGGEELVKTTNGRGRMKHCSCSECSAAVYQVRCVHPDIQISIPERLGCTA